MSENGPKPVRRQDYEQPAYLVEHVDLRFDLDAEKTSVRSRLTVSRNPRPGRTRALRLDGRGLELVSLALDGRPLAAESYRLQQDGLVIEAPLPERFDLEIVTRVHPSSNASLEGLFQSGPMLCTQCEAQGFSRITYFPDRPDIMSRYRVTLVADRQAYPVLLSNGNLVAKGREEGGRHWVTWEDPFPKPCYLFALVAGDLGCHKGSFRTMSGREVQLEIYVEHADIGRCSHAMASLRQAMHWDEARYGLEYDLDVFMIVATPFFNMGAMENKGLNIFNARYILASEDTATDRDFDAVRDIIGHEYFHNWTGNRVTCRDWFQLSLKESLTVFREQQFSADMSGTPVIRIEQASLLLDQQFSEDAGPTAHPVRPEAYLQVNNLYTLTVYEKGAEVIRMMHGLLGEAAFRAGMDLYFERHDGQAVTIEDFVNAMEAASGRDLHQFRLWYSQAGTPRLDATDSFSERDGTYRLTLRQSCLPTPGQPDKAPLHIPVAVCLFGDDGRLLEGTERLLELRQQEDTFEFRGLGSRPTVSLLRGFSAPVRLEYPYSDSQLLRLAAAETDEFCAWDACQRLYLSGLTGVVTAVQGGLGIRVPDSMVEVLAMLLESPRHDPALQAEMLRLPTETYLAERLERIDVDAVVRAWTGVRQALATRFTEHFWRLYGSQQAAGRYQYDPESVSRRRLRSTCLSWLGCVDTPELRTHCLQLARDAGNMTDCIAALNALNCHDSSERAVAMDEFRDRWKGNPLVLDKWYALEAMAPFEATPRRVAALLEHPSFDLRNPNRVRALLGSFCQSNLRGFHRADGSGYRLLAGYVQEIDGTNPQLAARLVMPLTRWRRFLPDRAALMRAELEAIHGRSGLSSDVHELVAKALIEA
jgi:aminopeptidase N